MLTTSYNKAIDAVLSYLIEGDSKRFELCKVEYELVNACRRAGVYCPDNVTKWSRKDAANVLDTLAFNGTSADIVDMRSGHRSHYNELYLKASSNARATTFNEVSVGKVSCVVSTEKQCFYGLSVKTGDLCICAEKVAITQAMTCTSRPIEFLLTRGEDGKVMCPCEDCLQFMRAAGMKNVWIAVEDDIWVPLRKVDWYASFYRA